MTPLAGLILVLLAAAAVLLRSYPGKHVIHNKFIVTYSLMPDPKHEFSFYDMPRTTAQATQDGFEYAADRLQEDNTTVWCRSSDYRVCVLFDQKGSVAGLQVSRSVKETLASDLPVDIEELPQWFRQTLLGVDVYSSISYFVDEDILQTGGRNLTDDTPTAPNGVRLLMKNSVTRTQDVPLLEDDLKGNNISFTEQNCFIGMGQHHFQVGPDSTYEDAGSYFALYGRNPKTMVGFGVTQFGNISVGRDGKNGWFEKPTVPILKLIAPNHPSWFIDWVEEYGLYTIHIYFVEKPWRTTCW